MRKLFVAKSLVLGLCASVLSVVPVVISATSSSATILDALQFPRSKVTSAFKGGWGGYPECYATAQTCTVQRSNSQEWDLPSGGYFKLERSVNPSWPWRVLSCSSSGSCSIASTIGKIFAFKPNQYFLYRAPNSSYNWIFSLGSGDPYLVSVGGNISWSFNEAGNGREGEYQDPPSVSSASITGSAAVGAELTAGVSYSGSDGHLTYQWKRSTETASNTFTNIAGATSATYTTTNDDSGKYLRVTVSVQNFFGTRSATSNYLQIPALPTKLDSTFGSVTSTLGGFTVNITNYDSSFTYEASVSAGTITLGEASGTTRPITVGGLSSEQSATVTVTTTKSGVDRGTGSVAGASLASAITTTTGPVGRWIASSISKDGSTYVVANQGGYLYSSIDDGVNWTQRASIKNWSSVTQSEDGQTIFATVAGGRIQKSTNGGASWVEVATAQNWRSIACSSDCQTIIAAANGGRLFRSQNYGSTWVALQSNQPWRQVAISSFGSHMAAVAYGGKIYTSINFGESFQQSGENKPWVSVAISENGSAVYAAQSTGTIVVSPILSPNWQTFATTSGNTYITLDRTNNQILQCGMDGAVTLIPMQGISIGRVGTNQTPWSTCALGDDSSKMMATSTTGLIYISTNGGDNWSARSIDSGNIKRRAVVANESGTQIYSAVYGGTIEYSADSGRTWSVALNVTQNWIAIAASKDLQKIYAVGYRGLVYRSVDSGITWSRTNDNGGALSWISVATSDDGSKVAIAEQGGNIYTSTDSGAEFIARERNRKWVSIASSSNGMRLIGAVQGGFLYTSTDGGETWTQRATSQRWSAVTSSSNGDRLVATVSQGKIHVSANGGASWSEKSSNRNWVNVASSSNGKKLIAVVGTGRIYTSSNSGSTWTARESARNWRALYISGNGNRAFAADFGKKLYSSTDSGESWTAL